MNTAEYRYAEAIRHVLWHIGDTELGQEPGSFTTHLLDAWARADLSNSASLASAFPDLGSAVTIAKIFGRDVLREELGKIVDPS